MNKKLKLVFLVIILVIFQGCATNAKFVQKYNSWVGYNIAHLIAQIGYPDDTFTLPNKNTVYVYERSRVYAVPSPMIGYGFGGTYGGFGYGMYSYGHDVVQETCKLFLETKKDGIIVRWSSRGNHCVSE